MTPPTPPPTPPSTPPPTPPPPSGGPKPSGLGPSYKPGQPYRPPVPTRFLPRPQKPTAKPRRVVGGVRLRSKEGPDTSAWAAQRWMRLIESCAPAANLAEGLEYARLGQARTVDVLPGMVNSKVQGRLPTSYQVTIRFPTFIPEQWEQVLGTMTEQARYAAALLSGDLPASIEDLFAPLGLRLFPAQPADLAVSCTCGLANVQHAAAMAGTPAQAGTPLDPAQGWCKHVCCVMVLIADRLGPDPFLLFALRGMRGEELLDKLRQQRALSATARGSGAGGGAGGGGFAAGADVPIYMPHLPGVNDRSAAPLESLAANFWSLGPGLEELELPIGPPEVTHPLLRRLGPSPFDASVARFPLVGLLATCYDVISAAAMRAEETPADHTD